MSDFDDLDMHGRRLLGNPLDDRYDAVVDSSDPAYQDEVIDRSRDHTDDHDDLAQGDVNHSTSDPDDPSDPELDSGAATRAGEAVDPNLALPSDDHEPATARADDTADTAGEDDTAPSGDDTGGEEAADPALADPATDEAPGDESDDAAPTNPDPDSMDVADDTGDGDPTAPQSRPGDRQDDHPHTDATSGDPAAPESPDDAQATDNDRDHQPGDQHADDAPPQRDNDPPGHDTTTTEDEPDGDRDTNTTSPARTDDRHDTDTETVRAAATDRDPAGEAVTATNRDEREERDNQATGGHDRELVAAFFQAESLDETTNRLPGHVLDRLDRALADRDHKIERDLGPLAATHQRGCVSLRGADQSTIWVCRADCAAATGTSQHQEIGLSWLQERLGARDADRLRPGAATLDDLGHLVERHGSRNITIERWDRLAPHHDSCIRLGATAIACSDHCTSRALTADQRAAVVDVAATLPGTPRRGVDWAQVADRAGSWDPKALADALTPTIDTSLHSRDCMPVSARHTLCAPDCQTPQIADTHPGRLQAAVAVTDRLERAGTADVVSLTWAGLARLAGRAGGWDRLTERCDSTVAAGAAWARTQRDNPSERWRIPIDRVDQLGSDLTKGETRPLQRWDGGLTHRHDCIRVTRDAVACAPRCIDPHLDADQRRAVHDTAAELRRQGHQVRRGVDWPQVANRAGSWDPRALTGDLTPKIDNNLHRRACIDVGRDLRSCHPDCTVRTARDTHPERITVASRVADWRAQLDDTGHVPLTWTGLERLTSRAGDWNHDAVEARWTATVAPALTWLRHQAPSDTQLNVTVDKLDRIGERLAGDTPVRLNMWGGAELHSDDCIRIGSLAVCSDCAAPARASPTGAVAAAAADWFAEHPDVRALPMTPARVEHLAQLVDGDPTRVAAALAEGRSDAWPPGIGDYPRVMVTDKLARQFAGGISAYFRRQVAKFRFELEHPLQALRHDVTTHPAMPRGRHERRGWNELPPWANQWTGTAPDVHPEAARPEASDRPPDAHPDPEQPPDTTTSDSQTRPSRASDNTEDNPADNIDDNPEDTPSRTDVAALQHWGDIDTNDRRIAEADPRLAWQPGPTITNHYLRTGTPLVERWLDVIESGARGGAHPEPYPGVEAPPLVTPNRFASLPEDAQATVLRNATINLRGELLEAANLWHHPTLGAHGTETWELYGTWLADISDAAFYWALKDMSLDERAYAFGGDSALLRARYEYVLRIESGLLPEPPAPTASDTIPRLPRFDDHNTTTAR